MNKELIDILLVEDNANDAYLIRDMLGESKTIRFNCRVADRISTALQQMSAGPLDVVLLDLSLPDSSGLSALVEIHGKEPSLPIVVLTGFDDESLGIQAVQEGAQDYLIKGKVDSPLLVKTVRYAIERKRATLVLEQNNRELQALYAKVSALEQIKTDMIRIASHDLLGIVGILKGYLELLRFDIWDKLADEPRSFFEEIEISTNRMETLTKDILSLERIESAAESQHAPLNLGELVEFTFQIHQAQADQKGQEYQLELPASPLTINGDTLQLQEAITNLINNAIKYTPEGGDIKVRLRQNGDMAAFEVQDSGYGVPPELQSRLFQPFFRAKSQETEHIQGTGLGLYLVNRVIERHQGKMYFHSVQGEGSTFGFTVPIAADS